MASLSFIVSLLPLLPVGSFGFMRLMANWKTVFSSRHGCPHCLSKCLSVAETDGFTVYQGVLTARSQFCFVLTSLSILKN